MDSELDHVCFDLKIRTKYSFVDLLKIYILFKNLQYLRYMHIWEPN